MERLRRYGIKQIEQAVGLHPACACSLNLLHEHEPDVQHHISDECCACRRTGRSGLGEAGFITRRAKNHLRAVMGTYEVGRKSTGRRTGAAPPSELAAHAAIRIPVAVSSVDQSQAPFVSKPDRRAPVSQAKSGRFPIQYT